MAPDFRPMGQFSHGVQHKLYRMEMRPEDMVDSTWPPMEESIAAALEAGPFSEVRRSANVEVEAPPAQFEHALQRARGGGEALSASTKAFMENRFGRDFSAVRVHRDARANTLARDINARAFTLNNNIFFGAAQYQPDSREGRGLLAHELTHVIQQSEGQLARQIQRQTSCSSYGSYDASAGLGTYNCGGLATRTYRNFNRVPLLHDSIVANFTESRSGNNCGAGTVKFWLWEYNVHFEDDLGTLLSEVRPEFHVVAGRTDLTGADPTDVYSKNGFRPVHGPGTGPSFRPATRERNLSNDASETPVSLRGRPAFIVRSNMSEAITCASCHP